MVGRTLRRKVEGDLQPVRLGCVDQPVEIGERAELGMDRSVPAFVATDRVGTARIVGPGRERIVLALAVDPADRVDRREIEHVVALFGDVGQAGDHVVERAVPAGVVGLTAGKQLVPRAGARP